MVVLLGVYFELALRGQAQLTCTAQGNQLQLVHPIKTVTEPLVLKWLGLASSEKQIPQVVEKLESGGKSKEALETAELRPRQVRYQAALRPDICTLLILQLFLVACKWLALRP